MDCLINKQYKNYDRLSRYGSFPIYYNTLDDKYANQIPSALDRLCSYTAYEVKDGESYDLISLKAYNNPTYFWIICDFNNILDPLIDPLPGTILKIPNLSTIEFSNY